MYKKTYDKIVYPMHGKDRWVKINYNHVDPLVEYNQRAPENYGQEVQKILLINIV
jgi:hypothetical protein